VTRKKAILLGLATIWPVIYMFLYMGFVVGLIFYTHQLGKQDLPLKIILLFIPVVFLHIITIVTVFSLLAYYVIYLFNSGTVPENHHLLWALVLILCNIFSMPVFWYLYVWRNVNSMDKPETSINNG
jgi:hypothetical protein